jgi:ribosomal protein L16 Arg81 hydroxylase
MQKASKYDLSALLGSVGLAAFFRDYWEQRPLALPRKDPAFYRQLFTRDDVGRLIAYTRPMFVDPSQFRTVVDSPPTYVRGKLPEYEPSAGFYPNLPEVRRAFAAGKTLILNSLERRSPAVAAMGRNLEAYFGAPVNTNLYLTPPKSQGLPPHYDPDEIFILQVDGSKHWRFFGVGRDLPLKQERMARKSPLGEPTLEVTVEPGDLLYIPRGQLHEAFTPENSSLHLTVSVEVLRWVDLLKRALDHAASGDARFRQSLPIGLMGQDAAPSGLSEAFRAMVQRFGESAQLDAPLAAMAETFIERLPSLPGDYFAVDDPLSIDADSEWELAAGVLGRVAVHGEKAWLHAPGVRLEWPAVAASLLRSILGGERFSARQLPGDLPIDARLDVMRRLASEKLIRSSHEQKR